MKKILVIGTGNDCRSLMMEGWLRYYSGNEAMIYSAGYSPAGFWVRIGARPCLPACAGVTD